MRRKRSGDSRRFSWRRTPAAAVLARVAGSVGVALILLGAVPGPGPGPGPAHPQAQLSTEPGAESGTQHELGMAARAFDGERALAHAKAMVDMGPRPLGSAALEENRVYIEEALRSYRLLPARDPFTAATPIGEVEMANIITTVPAANGETEGQVIVLSGHFDTKLFEGVDFVGANDGASSAGILLELARVLAEHPASMPVRIVFFDGEEAVVQWTAEDSTYGSRHMVAELQAGGTLGEIGALILLDMIGDADLGIEREGNSSPWLTEIIWNTAAEIGHGREFPNAMRAIEDDHIPFVRAGVAAVDLIDFDYGRSNRYWHSPFDTFDKLSASSLEAVGETVLTSLPKIAARLASQ